MFPYLHMHLKGESCHQVLTKDGCIVSDDAGQATSRRAQFCAV
ncbi:hypothetical protein P9684_03115 [Bacillus atrophaeus]|nr:hypothetical protein [Bacillus atrophaeus]